MNGRRLLHLLLMLLLLYRGSYGVEVLEFQKDGEANMETVAEYGGRLDRSWKLQSLTLCARFQIFHMHGRGTFFQLWDRPDNLTSQLRGELWLDRVRSVIAHRWKFQQIKEKFRAYRWYHLCFTYNHMSSGYKIYIDGDLNYKTTYEVDRPVYGDTIRLGQGEQLEHSFSGALSQVNVWDHPLSADTIAEMATCKIDLKGNYISWDAGWTLFNVTSYTVSLKQFCHWTAKTTYFWFPETSRELATYVCEALGSHLPLPTTMDEVHSWYNISSATWPDEPSLCRDNFWASIDDMKEEGYWVTHYDQSPVAVNTWKDNEPNGIFFENCAEIEPTGLADIDCVTNKRCSVCKFSQIAFFSLLGICESELQNVHFKVSQDYMGHLLFRGYGEYQIHKEGEEWVWFNVKTTQTVARLDPQSPLGMPMGRRTWHLETSVCGQMSGTRTLCLTSCPDQSYTCDDATCIPLDSRCDRKYDCQDNSDETNCQLVKKPNDYRKDLVPRVSHKNNNKSLPVALNITIESINIDTTRMMMFVSYSLKMTWYDYRLMFLNLKLDDNLNVLSFEEMMSLWTPLVGFMNTKSSKLSVMDKETVLYLRRLQPHTHTDNSAPGEVTLYSGEENPLIISRVYFTDYICDFNLVLYPFDQQHCDMHLRIHSASKEYITIDETSTSAKYISSGLLLEYQLSQLTVHFDKSSKFSDVKVRIPLKRRVGYALTDIYIPSLVLLLISYLSLFFRPHIFEVRIMTTLTALLVMATLFSQVSSSLPKTSYFKMVDVWLLFCIVMSFLIIIFHVIIDLSIKDVTNPGSYPPSKVTKVIPLSDPGALSPTPTLNTSIITKIYNFPTKGYVSMAQYGIFSILVLFNLMYWSYIFG
ncbi:hypothetical protein Pcinc_008254 [Petrolisthes cinctipes]|uniref:Pentraxin (PTX) domain-containing protein n=1 Tax=Petrolisthes cinctipes TaxID=88211 RepID=A0AAE1KXP9_PETCI|nr:hypothetical protein Pcinc_008254 [Petrolisthes cinctipes]